MSNKWVPDQEKVKKKASFDMLFTTPPSDAFLYDCAKISCFLTDGKAVDVQLLKLEKMLTQRLLEQNKSAEDKGYVHVLRTLLEDELGRFGFQVPFAQVTNSLSSQDFRYAISKGLLLKDSVLRNDLHGEFTHAIQWLLVAWQNEDSPFLSEDVVNVFKKFGGDNTIAQKKGGSSLWDLIFDGGSGADDFRAPEELNDYITSSHHLNNLRQIIVTRGAKLTPKNVAERKQNKYTQTRPGLFEPNPANNNDNNSDDSLSPSTNKTPKK